MTATVRQRDPIAVIPVYNVTGVTRRFVVALESHTHGYVVTEVESLDDTDWSANGWYYDNAPDAVQAAAFRALLGPLPWEMVRAMTTKGCVSR